MGHGIRYRRITRHRLPRIGATMCLDRAHRPHQIQWRIAALLLVIGLAGAARATEAIEENFFDMSLEDLMNVEITSVSKHKQKVSQAPAAISVITQDDIRRS